jgi:hypothetical protein
MRREIAGAKILDPSGIEGHHRLFVLLVCSKMMPGRSVRCQSGLRGFHPKAIPIFCWTLNSP